VIYVARHVDQPLAAMSSGFNRAIAGTRGGAMGLARIDRDTHAFEYAAVGNTRVLLVDRDQRRYLASSPGIVGGGYRHLCRETGTLPPGARVFLYTDGFPRAIDSDEFCHRLHERDLQRLADALLTGLGTPTDDSAILIYQHPGGAS